MKNKFTFLLLTLTITGYSQSGAKWATGGNSLSTGDFFGTTNNFPIDFKTNNVSRMNLSTTGVLKLNSLAGTGSRLLQTDANGNIIFLPAGLSNQVLYAMAHGVLYLLSLQQFGKLIVLAHIMVVM